MTIAKSEQIVYDDLIKEVTNKIKSVCKNINTLNVPDSIKNGTVNVDLKNGNFEFKATVSDSLTTSAVPQSTVENQLTSFLSGRGIQTRKKETITTRDILNFYQNVAIFMSIKLVQATSQYNSGDPVMLRMLMFQHILLKTLELILLVI